MTVPYPEDFGDQEHHRPYAFEEHGYWLRYVRNSKVAHIVREHIEASLCGLEPWDWYGSGSQREWEKAHAMPLCKTCVRLSGNYYRLSERLGRVSG